MNDITSLEFRFVDGEICQFAVIAKLSVDKPSDFLGRQVAYISDNDNWRQVISGPERFKAARTGAQVGTLDDFGISDLPFGGRSSLTPKPDGGYPQANRGPGQDNSENGNNAFVVMLQKPIEASKKNQESPEERGAAMLIIIIAGMIVLICVYEATWSVGERPTKNFENHKIGEPNENSSPLEPRRDPYKHPPTPTKTRYPLV
jgi:hypothetical protein